MSKSWPESVVQALVDMWQSGYSASQIAAALPTDRKGHRRSRNAVIGKAHRLGLTDADRKPDRVTRVRMKRNRKRVFATGKIPDSMPKPRPPVWPTAPLPQDQPTDVARVTLLDLESHHCRYPVGTPTAGFCGLHTVPGLSYCPEHAARCYRPAEPRRESSRVESRTLEPAETV